MYITLFVKNAYFLAVKSPFKLMELKILNGEDSKSCRKGLNPFWHGSRKKDRSSQ